VAKAKSRGWLGWETVFRDDTTGRISKFDRMLAVIGWGRKGRFSKGSGNYRYR
jgi:hypothetical protein